MTETTTFDLKFYEISTFLTEIGSESIVPAE